MSQGATGDGSEGQGGVQRSVARSGARGSSSQGESGKRKAQCGSKQLAGVTEGGAEGLKEASGGRAEELDRGQGDVRLGGTISEKGDLWLGGTRGDKGDFGLGGTISEGDIIQFCGDRAQ